MSNVKAIAINDIEFTNSDGKTEFVKAKSPAKIPSEEFEKLKALGAVKKAPSETVMPESKVGIRNEATAEEANAAPVQTDASKKAR